MATDPTEEEERRLLEEIEKNDGESLASSEVANIGSESVSEPTASTPTPGTSSNSPAFFTWEQVQSIISSIKSDSQTSTTSLPKLTLREFKESEILTTKGRFKRWLEMVKLELTAANRQAFIEENLAMSSFPNMSEEIRRATDASVMQLLRVVTSKHVWAYIHTSTTAYDAFEKILQLFKNTDTQDMVHLNREWEKLAFKPGYNQLLYVTRFDQLLVEYAELGCTFSDEYKRTIFLSKITEIDQIESPMYTFYKNANALPHDQRNIENTKKMFLDTDLSKWGKENSCLFATINSTSLSGTERTSTDNLDCNINTMSVNLEAASKRKRENTSNTSSKPDKRQKLEKSDSMERQNSNKKFENRNFAAKFSKPNRNTSSKPLPKKASDKYSPQQMAEIASWTAEEKARNRCKNCSDYFHTADDCKNSGPLCFNCYEYGHFAKSCSSKSRSEYKFCISDFEFVLEILADSAASHHVTNNKN
jgi:hypothetical protein